MSKSRGQSQEQSRVSVPPKEALKRFAQDLSLVPIQQRYLVVNYRRVNQFIDRPHADPVFYAHFRSEETGHANAEEGEISNVAKTAGCYEYKKRPYRNNLYYQNFSEFQKELGFRSRFGDGDGSFFDLWLNSEMSLNKRNTDGSGLPKITLEGNPKSGFKRYYMPGIDPEDPDQWRPTIEPYHQRRQKRLERETDEKSRLPPMSPNQKVASLDFSGLGRYDPLKAIKDATKSGRRSSIMSPRGTGRDSEKLKATTLGEITKSLSSRKKEPMSARMRPKIEDDDDLYAIKMPPLTDIERDTYFGEKGRASFFDFYRQLLRQSHLIYTNNVPDATMTNLMNEDIADRVEAAQTGRRGSMMRAIGSAQSSLLSMSMPRTHTASSVYSSYPATAATIYQTHTNMQASRTDPSLMPIGTGRRSSRGISASAPMRGYSSDSVGSDSDDTDSTDSYDIHTGPKKMRSQRNMGNAFSFNGGMQAANSWFRRSARSDRGNMARQIAGDWYGRHRATRAPFSPEVLKEVVAPQVVQPEETIPAEMKLMKMHANIPHSDSKKRNLVEKDSVGNVKDVFATIGIHPVSARTRYLVNCVQKSVEPDPSLILRKDETPVLNVSNKFISNEMATIFAESLGDMPYLEELNVASNRLADNGLSAIIRAIEKTEYLKTFNMSDNNVGPISAKALEKLMRCFHCNISDLIASDCGINDTEAALIVQAMSERKSIKLLDFTRNKIGSHEISLGHFASGENVFTGAEALAKYIANDHCKLKTLRLAWNSIRLTSAYAFMGALKTNKSLTSLDLSYNMLNNDGGEALGDALETNKTLTTLNITHNNLQARGCFTVMIGARLCPTLEFVDISENPIGDRGFRAVTAVRATVANRIPLEVQMLNCALKAEDPTAWFDFKTVKGTYKLHLESAYERAVCIELLNLTANRSELQLLNCKYTNNHKFAKPEPVRLEMQHTKKSDQYRRIDEQYLQILSILDDPDKVRNLFHQLDEDDSGALDKNEIKVLLKSLGVSTDEIDRTVHNLFIQFDHDGSGAIEEEEFLEFLEGIIESANAMIKEHLDIRYYADVDKNFVDGLGYLAPFVPDRVGTLEFTIARKEGVQYLHSSLGVDIKSLISASTEFQENLAAVHIALESSKRLKFDEAVAIQKIYAREYGRLGALKKILRRMGSPSEARKLVTRVLGNEVNERMKLALDMGKLYHLCIGYPNGYYNLDLGAEEDNFCLLWLLDIDGEGSEARRESDLGRLSQDPDGRNGFRNVLYDGQPLVMTDEWIKDIPNRGRLEFDFVTTKMFSIGDQPMSDARFVKLLMTLRLVLDEEKGRLLTTLSTMQKAARSAARGVGTVVHQITGHNAESIGKHLDKLHDHAPKRRSGQLQGSIAQITERREYLSQLNSLMKASQKSTSAKRVSSSGSAKGLSPPQSAKGRSRMSPGGSLSPSKAPSMASSRAASSRQLSRNSTSVKEIATYSERVMNEESATLASIYSAYLAGMMENPSVSYSTMATQLIDSILELFGGRKLTCAQLALLVQLFPRNEAENTGYVPTVKQRQVDPEMDKWARNYTQKQIRVDYAELREQFDVDAILGTLHSLAHIAEESSSEKSSEKDSDENYSSDGSSDSEGSPPGRPSQKGKFGGTSSKNDKSFGHFDERSRLVRKASFQDPMTFASEVQKKNTNWISMVTLTDYSSLVVELVIALFSQLVDPVNFEVVYEEMSIQEHGMLLYRLGYLNTWNPLKPEGFYSLDLSRREEKQIVRTLMLLTTKEPGQNWLNLSYRPKGRHDKEQKNFERDVSWLLEEVFPNKGVLSLRYFSGGGSGLMDCSPNIAVRLALTALVRAEPYPSDVVNHKAPTMSDLKHLLNETGCTLNFE